MNIIPWLGHRSALANRRHESRESEFQALERSFGRMLSEFWADPFRFSPADAFDRLAPLPTIDIKNKKNEIVISAEVPGMSAEDVDVEVNDRILTISGEKSESEESREGDSYYSERRYGHFSRSIELPPEADPDSIEAKVKKGVLTIRVKKSNPTNSKKVSVNA